LTGQDRGERVRSCYPPEMWEKGGRFAKAIHVTGQTKRGIEGVQKNFAYRGKGEKREFLSTRWLRVSNLGKKRSKQEGLEVRCGW